jgi:hypothetical protein
MSTARPDKHIRCRPRRRRGNTFYKVSGPNGTEKTLCGAPATDQDSSWAETRWASNRAYVTCTSCPDLRIAQGVATERVLGGDPR